MQNEIDIQLTDAQLAALDTQLAALETFVQGWPVLSAADKSTHVKAPDDSRGWMNDMLARARQNIDHLPRDFDPDLVQHDLDLADDLNPRLLRLERVVDKFTNAIFLAGSDSFADLLEVRRRLMDAGVAGVDDNLSDGLSRFFKRTKSNPAPAPAATK